MNAKLYEHERLYQAKRDAADDLYAALERIIAETCDLSFDKCPHWVEWHKVGRDALAKARGESA